MWGVERVRIRKSIILAVRMAEIEKLAAELENERRQREGMQAQQMAASEQVR